jgi:hypothetical protein
LFVLNRRIAMRSEVHQLRVNVKSLAAESRIIRQEIALAYTPECKNALAAHRQQRVKPEARYAQLALAFVRGVPYKQVEAHVREGNEPNAVVLFKKLVRFGVLPPKGEQDVRAWLDLPATVRPFLPQVVTVGS